jgi:hypothetical protein
MVSRQLAQPLAPLVPVLILLQQAMSPITSLDPTMHMFERGKSREPFFAPSMTARSSLDRPVSHVSVAYTDIEDDSSEFEEYSGSSVCIPRHLYPYISQLTNTL